MFMHWWFISGFRCVCRSADLTHNSEVMLIIQWLIASLYIMSKTFVDKDDFCQISHGTHSLYLRSGACQFYHTRPHTLMWSFRFRLNTKWVWKSGRLAGG